MSTGWFELLDAVRVGSHASAGVLLGVWSIGSMLGATAFAAPGI